MKIKVLQLGMPNDCGGIENFLINYLRNFNKNKFQIDFVNIGNTEFFYENEINKLGSNIFYITSYKKNPIKYTKELVSLIRKKDYDIIHCNMSSAVFLFPLLAAKLSKTKTIIAHAHNNYSDKGLFKHIIHSINKKFIGFLADEFYACSKSAGEYFFSKKILKSKKFKIIYNGIDIEKFKYSENNRNKIRKKLGIKDNTFLIGHVGRFSLPKNHDFIIDIFSDIQKKDENVNLLFIGNGELKDKIKNKVSKLKLNNKVIFLSNRDDVNELLSACDVFLFPSLYEGLGIALVEAQCAKLPCVTGTNIPKEAKISDNYTTLDLKEISETWAKEVLKYKYKKSNSNINYDLYDINKCVLKLEKEYSNFAKIKICHFVHGIVNGGVERFLLNYFSRMNLENYDLHIISQGKSDEKCKKEFTDLGFRVYEVTRKKVSFIKNYREIKRILKNEKFEIVHAHMTITNFFPLFYSFLRGVKVRISHSHSVLSKSLFNTLFITLGKLFATTKFACSKDAAISLFQKMDNVKIINNAIDVSKFTFNKKDREKYRKELNLQDKIVIGHIGRFENQKNHNFIVEMFDELVKANDNFVLLLIGIGELQNEIKTKVKKLKLEKNIMFLDTRSDVSNLFNAFDIFILPSLFEGLGIVLVEAQANGLNCLATKGLPNEVKITNNLNFLELNKNLWIDNILNVKLTKRDNYKDTISNSGYNIDIEVLKLDEHYKYLSKGERK